MQKSMQFFDRKVILKYLYDQLTGNFAGFLIGISASGLVSQFFETRSLRNLWGVGARKTVIDRETFSNLEWIISIVIGFIAFEIVTKVVKEKIDKSFPLYRLKFLRWAVRHNLRVRFKGYETLLRNRRVVLFTGLHGALKNAFRRYSRR